LSHSYFYCEPQYISRIDQSLLDMVFNILLILHYLAELTAGDLEVLKDGQYDNVFRSKNQKNNMIIISFFNHNKEN
jgi:hypothetical protein